MNVKRIKHMSGQSISIKDKTAMSAGNGSHLVETVNGHVIQTNIKTGHNDEDKREETLMSNNGVKSGNDI